MIKILFLIHDLSVGGAEKVLVNLVNNMDPEKFDISVVSLFGGGVNEQFLKSHVHYRYVFSKTVRGNSYMMKLLSPEKLHRICIREHYDIEVAYLEGPSARIISGCTDEETKLVSWIHGEQHNAKTAAGSFRTYEESSKCYGKFDRIVCVSDCVRQDFSNIYTEIASPIVLYNTNETEQIQEKGAEETDPGLFRDDEIKLVGVGRLIPIKGFDRLAHIHHRLREEGYSVHTYVLGIGPDQEKIENYLKQYGLEESFTFLGYQTNPYRYVSKCDLFVCSSHAEGFSTAATEALIVGTPVCTVDVSGMEEMLGSNNEYGVITENTEEALLGGIKNLIDHPDKLEAYKIQAQKRGAFFDKTNTVYAVEQMFTDLVDTVDTVKMTEH